jgi:hypothetical protein
VRSTPSEERYFCNEPWIGVLGIETNRDVTFCPCYLSMKIGNLDEAPMQEIWNAPVLVAMRRAFSVGVLPAACESQLCPVVLREDGEQTQIPLR